MKDASRSVLFGVRALQKRKEVIVMQLKKSYLAPEMVEYGLVTRLTEG